MVHLSRHHHLLNRTTQRTGHGRAVSEPEQKLRKRTIQVQVGLHLRP